VDVERAPWIVLGCDTPPSEERHYCDAGACRTVNATNQSSFVSPSIVSRIS
jgi:hypothetical protein